MEDYNFLYQFDGNLTDDTGKTTLAVDSGTPAYVTGDHGQALTVSSAGVSNSLPVDQFRQQRLIHFVINLRFNTGGTDGNIFTVDTGSKTILQLNRIGTTLRLQNWHSNQVNVFNTDETMTLDQWLCFGFTMWVSTPYRELEPGTTGTNFSSLWYSWANSDFGSDVKFLMGQTGNAASAGGTTTVATGVDVDFALFDNYGEGGSYSQPLKAGFDVRSAANWPTTNLKRQPTSIILNADGLDPFINLNNVTKVIETGGGGTAGPVIKEFWS